MGDVKGSTDGEARRFPKVTLHSRLEVSILYSAVIFEGKTVSVDGRKHF